MKKVIALVLLVITGIAVWWRRSFGLDPSYAGSAAPKKSRLRDRMPIVTSPGNSEEEIKARREAVL